MTDITTNAIAFIVTFANRKYKAIIQGLLPEVSKQRKLSQAEMKSVLEEWKSFTGDNAEEYQLETISKLLQRGIALTRYFLPASLVIISVLVFAAVLSAKALEGRSVTKNNSSSPTLTTTVLNCKALENYVFVAEFGVVSDRYSPNFDGGNLTAKFAANGTANDCLTIRSSDDVSVRGSRIFYKGNPVGDFRGGEGKEPLVVSFMQNATRETVQAVTRKVAYSLDTSGNPTYGERTVEFQVTDGDGGDSLKKGRPTQVIRVIDKNNSISINVPSSQKVKENTDLSIDSVKINASSNSSFIVNLKVENGTLTVKENLANGLIVDKIKNNRTSEVILRGTVNEINATLSNSNAVFYKGKQGFSGNDSLIISANEVRSGTSNLVIWPPLAQSVQSASKSIGIKVQALNPSPVIQVPNRQTVTENEDLIISDITVKDSNNIIFSLEVKNGKLILKTNGKLPSENIKGNATKKVVLNGNTELISETLGANNLVYQSNSNYIGNDVITITANDGKTTTTKTISITVNDNPVLKTQPFVATSDGRKISKSKAEALIRSWIESKEMVFAPPFDVTTLNSYTTGKYRDGTRKRVRELIKDGDKITFAPQPQVEAQGEFFAEGGLVIIDVKVAETTYYWRFQQSEPGSNSKGIHRWTLQFEDNRWKIAERVLLKTIPSPK